jgi:hypothetical protein
MNQLFDCGCVEEHICGMPEREERLIQTEKAPAASKIKMEEGAHQITRKELLLMMKALEVAADDTNSAKVKSEYMDLRQRLKSVFG